MRPQSMLRATRPMAVGALGFATLTTGVSAVAQAQNTNQDAISVSQSRTHVVTGRNVLVQGSLRDAKAGSVVALQVRRGGSWRTLKRDATDAGGRYRLRYRARRPGSWLLRVRLAGPQAAAATANPAPAARPRETVGRLNVYRRAYASWYGPGLYGGHLACGGTLTPGTLGVAHKSLPCGTKITLRYHGRSVRVPVVDRGPYVGGREYDLTEATAQRLKFKGHGSIQSTK
jgi:rare lipoprotein A